MKLLIVGASGFIGRQLHRESLSRGYDVLGTQSSDQCNDLIPFNLLNDRIEDVLPTTFLQGSEPIYAVICAAISKIEFCSKNRELTHQVNVTNTIQLLKDLQSLGIKSVFLSSDAVYDGQKGHYSEEVEGSPVNEYGRHKAKVEDYILKYAPTDLVLRLSKIVGDNPYESHLFSEWYQCIKFGKAIVQFDGQVFSPTYVGDIAEGILNSLKKEISGLYNMANPEFFSREELARQFILALGEKINLLTKPEESFGFLEGRAKKTYLDSSKFARTVGMKFTPMCEVFNMFVRNCKK